MRALCATALSLAAWPAAGDISLEIPVACKLGENCYIQQYVDHDPGGGAKDFRCAPLTYDGHQGTDFALKTRAALESGVNVLAAAPGIVRGVRDGMADRIYQAEHATELDGRDCGNGVAITHADGWTTQYCHLKRGSIAVSTGDTVAAGDILGQIGLSGRTQFPHMHMTLRKDNEVVDPFDPDGQITCGAPSAETLWTDPPDYAPGGILHVGFADAVPAFDAIKAGTATQSEMPTDAQALVVFAYAFGSQAGDVMRLRIEGPDGVFMDEHVDLDRTQAQFFRAIGRRLRAPATPGTYVGTATLLRGGELISERSGTVTLR